MELKAEMEVSALRYPGGTGLHGRSPLLRLQSDERLVTLTRRGNQSAFEVLVSRYQSRLQSFCRHLLGSREDAEDVLQDVFTASYNAMLADDRTINVRPWLYRIARNRCLNHLRRNRAVGVDSMDIHFADHGASTADKAHDREEFRQLLDDIRDLPETQRTALILREMDALSYEQIAEAMETTVSSVKSLLVRARVSLTEAAQARLLSCDQVREELAEIAEGMRRKMSAPVRRHVKNCSHCEVFQGEMRRTNKALAALAPFGPLALFRKLLFAHAGHSAAGSAGAHAGVSAIGAGSAGSAAAGAAGATGAAGAAGAASAAGGSASGLITAGVGAVATKAAAGLAAAALVTAGTVAVTRTIVHHHQGPSAATLVSRSVNSGVNQAATGSAKLGGSVGLVPGRSGHSAHRAVATASVSRVKTTPMQATTLTKRSTTTAPPATTGTHTRKTVAVTGTSPTALVVTTPAYEQTTPGGTAGTVTTTTGTTGGVSPLAPTTTTSATGTSTTPATSTTGATTTPTSTTGTTSTTSTTGTTTAPTSTTSTTPTSTGSGFVVPSS